MVDVINTTNVINSRYISRKLHASCEIMNSKLLLGKQTFLRSAAWSRILKVVYPVPVTRTRALVICSHPGSHYDIRWAMTVKSGLVTDLGTDTGLLPVCLARIGHQFSREPVTGPAVICPVVCFSSTQSQQAAKSSDLAMPQSIM